MSNASTIILAPFLFAFLIFTARFYIKEGAYSKLQPSFLLASATLLTAGAYLFLVVMKMLPDYAAVGFGSIGLLLLAVSIYRMFTI